MQLAATAALEQYGRFVAPALQCLTFRRKFGRSQEPKPSEISDAASVDEHVLAREASEFFDALLESFGIELYKTGWPM